MGRSAGPAVLLKLRAIYILEHKWEAGARSRRKGSPLRFGRVPGKHQGCACPTVMGYHMNKLKWVKDLNVRPETIKLLEENTVWFLTSVLIIFLNLSPQVRATKAKINK